MYAVIRSGSKQYRVEPGQEVLVDLLKAEPGSAVALTDVLLYSDGKELSVGTPVVPVTVHCKCVGHELGDKLRTTKYRRRKNYMRRYGHRQEYTRLAVERFESKGN